MDAQQPNDVKPLTVAEMFDKAMREGLSGDPAACDCNACTAMRAGPALKAITLPASIVLGHEGGAVVLLGVGPFARVVGSEFNPVTGMLTVVISRKPSRVQRVRAWLKRLTG